MTRTVDAKEMIDAMYKAHIDRHAALGMKLGEGGKFAPYMAGYAAALEDMRRFLWADTPTPPSPQ